MSIAGHSGSNQIRKIRMDFEARRYDTFAIAPFKITYYDSKGILQTLSLTGCKAQMQVRKRKSDLIPVLYVDVAITGDEIALTKNHLEMGLDKGRYYHDLEIKDADGNHVTWIEGIFTVLEHVTHYAEDKDIELGVIFTTALKMVNAISKYLPVSPQAVLRFVAVLSQKKQVAFNIALKFGSIKWIVKTYKLPWTAYFRFLPIPVKKLSLSFTTAFRTSTRINKFYGIVFSTKLTFTTQMEG